MIQYRAMHKHIVASHILEHFSHDLFLYSYFTTPRSGKGHTTLLRTAPTHPRMHAIESKRTQGEVIRKWETGGRDSWEKLRDRGSKAEYTNIRHEPPK